MFNLASLIIGFVALIFALVAFIPLLGWANWLIIPLAIIGAGVGMISRSTAGRNLNLFVIVDRRRPADARRRDSVSRDPRIDAYIAKAQPFARPILEHVRERVHAVVPDVEEAMKWSMPAYTLDGKIVLDHRRLQSACGAQFLARAGARRRARQGRRDGPVRQAHVASTICRPTPSSTR